MTRNAMQTHGAIATFNSGYALCRAMAKKSAKKMRVLFVDEKNDTTSQLAEHYANSLFGDRCEAFSAGPKHDIVDCEMISVAYMSGEDLRKQVSKDFKDEYGLLPRDGEFDYVVFLLKSVYDEWAPRTPWQGRQILADLGGIKDYEYTDDKELMEAYQMLMAKVRGWVSDNIGDAERLKAAVSA